MLNELMYKIKENSVLEIKDDLVSLYELELFSQKVYFDQIRKLDGTIVETLKELLEQEEKHAHFLKILLLRTNIKIIEKKDFFLKIDNDLLKNIKFDINLENDSTKKYEKAINKSNFDSMKAFLKHILEEEKNHIIRLQAFV